MPLHAIIKYPSHDDTLSQHCRSRRFAPEFGVRIDGSPETPAEREHREGHDNHFVEKRAVALEE